MLENVILSIGKAEFGDVLIPGKAMVVVLRAGMSVPSGARAATAAIATFYETLVMMAAGSLLSAVLGFAAAGGSPHSPVDLPVCWGAGGGALPPGCHRDPLGLGLAFLVVVLPPVFRRLSLRVISLPFPSVGARAVPRCSRAWPS